VTVRAAGGIPWRVEDGRLQVLVVHRPKYDDWTLPKGKAYPDETDEECALREVAEETGLRCELGRELAGAEYTDSQGRPKTVRFWALRPVDGAFSPHAEIDDARWLSLGGAHSLVSYERDRVVLDSFARVLLVRHATAGHRESWDGDDTLRPLDEQGVRQADGLVTRLAGWPIARILSSPYVRCVESVAPLAAARGLEVETTDALAEGTSARDVLALVENGDPVVLCTHGDVIEELLGEESPKGSTWVLDVDGLRVRRDSYLSPPA
jgi:8-oxo-(d)GTP phosphatase